MKKLITNYNFVASAKTVELSDYGSDFDIKGLLLIVNVTDNITIYNFAVDGLGHSSVTDDVVTLELAAITGMSNSDELLIYYDDPAGTQLVDLGTNNDIKIASGQVESGAFASGSIASGAVSSGAIASGAIASGAIASGAIANGAIASGALVSGSVADGAMVTLGAKADAKNSATDTTSITAMQVLKQISHELQETISGTLADNTSNPDTTVHGSMIMGLEADGNWDRLKSTSGELQVTIPNLEHAEDSSHTSTDKGIMPLAVRNDTLAALAGTDGDYAPLQVNATGALFVEHASLTELSDAINSNKVDVNISGGGFDGAVTNAGLTAIDAAIGTTGNTGPTKAMSIAATLSGGNLQELLADGDGHLQIDVLSAPSTAVTNTGLTALDGAIHAEDAAHGSGDTGIMPLAVRNDTLAALGGTDGDYAPLQVNSSGALYVDFSTSAVDGAYLNVNMNLNGADAQAGEGTITSSTQRVTLATDDDGVAHLGTIAGAIFAEDVAHSSGNAGIMPLAVRNDTLAALGGTDGDYAPLQVNAAGALYVDFSTSAVDGAYLNTNLNIAGADLAAGAGNMSAQTARVTIASDDTHYGAVGAAADVDGVIHGQLRYIGDAVGAIQTAVQILDDWDDSNYANVNMNLAGSDAQAGEGAITSSTQRVTIATDDDSTAHLATIAGAVDTELQVDIVGALPTGSNAIGKLAANSGVDIGDVDVTSTVVPAGQATLTSYDQFDVSESATTLAAQLSTTETAAKEIFIQAGADNTGFFMVGSSGTSATSTLRGVRLDAGDTLILAVADITDIYMDASAGSQKALVTITK